MGVGLIAAARRRTASPPATDPFFSDTHLLLGLDSVNVGRFFDESAGNHGFSSTSNIPDLDTSNKVFGAGSAKFTASSLDRLTWGDSIAWSLNVDTTIEFFVYFTNVGVLQSLVSHYNASGNQRSWDFQYRGADATKTLSLAASSNGSSASFLLQHAWTPTVNTWYYVCLERSGNVFRTYAGPLAGTASMVGKTTSAFTFFDSSESIAVGAVPSGSGAAQALDGNIDELRYTYNHARYNTDAGYSVPTSAFPRS